MNKDKIFNQVIDVTNSLLEDKHVIKFLMEGNSMYPTFRNGDYGFIEKCSPNALKKGDIIVFRVKNKLIAHRLISIQQKEGSYILQAKGDFNNYADTQFSAEQFIGKIKNITRGKSEISDNKPTMKCLKFLSINFPKILRAFSIFHFRINYNSISLFSNLKLLNKNFRVILKGSEKYFLINSLISVLQGITPFAIIVCIKMLIDFLTNNTTNSYSDQIHFYLLLVITALIFLLSGILTEVKTYFSEKLGQSVSKFTYDKLQQKHTTLDLSNYENPTKQDNIHRAVQEASFRPLKIMNAILMGIKSVASVLFLIGLFVSIRWYLVLILVVAIVPDVFIRLKYSRRFYALKESQSTKEREMYYYNRVLTGFPFAKELKLFGFADFFKKRFENTQNELFEQKIKLRKSELIQALSAQIFAIILIFVSLGYVSYLKINGAITIGTVVLFFFAFQRGYSVLNEFFRSITQIIEDNSFLDIYINFLNLPSRSISADEIKPAFSLQKEIKLTDVSFNYETSKRDAIKSVNISIPAGKTVAFVGANGSGKTTLIKLLCGFYEPNNGSIFFDNVDSKQLGQKEICNNISAVFQDFALYNIPAFKNITLGDIQQPFNPEKAREAAKEAGIDNILENLPHGYNTLLGNLFKEGEELSIGQWQKIAIARAFYRNSPLIIMDEPSSALDAESELQILQSLKNLSKEKTAIIISHRLSTVQWADLIYFFHEGEIHETGTHEELMDLRGKYYKLFQTANQKIN